MEITLTEHASTAIVQRLVRAISFRATRDSAPGERNIEFSLRDGDGVESNRLNVGLNVA